MRITSVFIAAVILCNMHCYSAEHFIEHIQEDLHKAKHDLGTLAGLISPELGEKINGEQKAIANNPYKHTDAHVRHIIKTSENEKENEKEYLAEGEKEYLVKRLPIVKATLEKLLNNRELTEKNVPKIAIVNSGGGYRAMLCTIGSLRAAKKIGLLDATTYVTGLSGSTWAIAPWISTGISLKIFEQYIIDCASKPFTDLTDEEQLLIFDTAAVKSTYNQAKTPVDLYGDLLGNRLLAVAGNDRHMIYLSDQAKRIENGAYPYPIYTAIDADEKIAKNQTWYEFTPHEIGNPIDKTYIPSWAYGRKFKNGQSVKEHFDTYPPEKNLGYHMGTWGSAFGANIRTIEKEVAKKIGHWEFVENLLKPIESERPLDFYAQVPNYMYKMDPEKHRSKNKLFVDAGTDFNLPVSPVSGLCPERTADILIICDASAGHIGNQLEKTAEYMKKHKLPFPKINFENIDKKTISVFKDKNDPNVPIVIYLPRISDPQLWEQHKSDQQYAKYNLSGFDLNYEANHGFAQTIHFQYTPENAQKVVDQTAFNMRVNQAKIIKAIEWKMNQKSI